MIPARLASGRMIDLEAMPDRFDWGREIAGPLSRITRFAGQMPHDFTREPNCYSVAEHCCRGADAIHAEALIARPGDSNYAEVLAFAFLMHDDHEAFTGDPTRPLVSLACTMATEHAICAPSAIKVAINLAKDHISTALHRAAGIPFPLPPEIAAIVKSMDDRMCATEQRHWWQSWTNRSIIPAADPGLAHCAPVDVLDWRDPFDAGARPWRPDHACVEWICRFDRWQPGAQRFFSTLKQKSEAA